MFGWLKDRFTNTGRLEKASRNLKAAANRYGNPNTRNAAKKAAHDLEATADTTKAAVDMAEKNLSDIQKKCASDITTARNQAREARASHDKVKLTTFDRIKRLAELGPSSWKLTRSAAENLRQKQLSNAAEKKRSQLEEIATKQQKAIDDEEAAFKRKKELIAAALGTAKSAATEAKNTVVPTVAPVNNKVKNAQNAAAAAKAAGMEALMGGRRRGGRRGRTHKRR